MRVREIRPVDLATDQSDELEVQTMETTYEWVWKMFTAQFPGKYLSMTVVGREISIHESKYLEKGETMRRPHGAFIMFVAEEPGPDEEDGK